MIEIMPESSGNVVGFFFKTAPTLEEIQEVFEPTVMEASGEGGVRVMCLWGPGVDEMDMAAMGEIGRFTMSHQGRLEKLAVVGKPSWGGVFPQELTTLVSAQLNFFNSDQIDQAWAWLKE